MNLDPRATRFYLSTPPREVKPFIEKRLREAVIGIGLDPLEYMAGIQRAVDWIVKHGLPFYLARRKNRNIRSDGKSLDFAAKLGATFALLKPYGVTAAQLIRLNLRECSLLFQDPETTRHHFETGLVVAETPNYQPRWPGRRSVETVSFRQWRIHGLLSHSNRLGLSAENYLLRLACAEVLNPPPAALLLNEGRKSLERRLIETLGHRAVPAAKDAKRLDPTISAQIDAYAKQLCKRLREMPEPLEPRLPEPAITSIFWSGGTALNADLKSKTLLLNGMVAGGLIKYHTVGAVSQGPRS